jgi:hypothetical protein
MTVRKSRFKVYYFFNDNILVRKYERKNKLTIYMYRPRLFSYESLGKIVVVDVEREQ